MPKTDGFIRPPYGPDIAKVCADIALGLLDKFSISTAQESEVRNLQAEVVQNFPVRISLGSSQSDELAGP